MEWKASGSHPVMEVFVPISVMAAKKCCHSPKYQTICKKLTSGSSLNNTITVNLQEITITIIVYNFVNEFY
jgi:hypothetical protein